jgi:hypothetical protein
MEVVSCKKEEALRDDLKEEKKEKKVERANTDDELERAKGERRDLENILENCAEEIVGDLTKLYVL